MLLSPYIAFAGTSFLNQFVHRRLLCNLMEINVNTTKSRESLIDSIGSIELGNSESIDDYFKSHKIARKILKQYWKEYIYITPHDFTSGVVKDIVARSYLIQDISVAESNKMRMDLRECLINGDIKVSYLRNFSCSTKKFPIKYIRKKYVHRLYTDLLKLYQNSWQKHFVKQSYGNTMRKLEEQKLPVFIIVNGLGEVVVGEPEHMIGVQKSFSNSFLGHSAEAKAYQLPLREAYVFMSPLDAVEYYNYLRSKYPYSFNELKLKIFAGTLSEYYKKNRFPIRNVRFRLLPDLGEIGNLLKVYRYKSNVIFNPKQVRGRNYFQGQPIYLIKPVMCKHVDQYTGKITKRPFPNISVLGEMEYSNVFTSYRTALSVWTKYRQKFREYTLPKQPNLIVYNLEGFLKEKEYEQFMIGDSKIFFRLIPSYETYQYIKNIQQVEKSKLLRQTTYAEIILLIKVTINRVLWGMIRWYPPT